MRVATIGSGNVGGGLADRWQKAGHEVTRIGRGGGDVSDADAVLVAVPAFTAGALEKVAGLDGKTVIDATNLVGAEPPEGFPSNAEFVKSRTGGPTAKAFNINFAALYDQLDAAEPPPANLWCGDEEARTTVEELCRDAGFEPVSAGPLENAAMQERFIDLVFAIAKEGGLGSSSIESLPRRATEHCQGVVRGRRRSGRSDTSRRPGLQGSGPLPIPLASCATVEARCRRQPSLVRAKWNACGGRRHGARRGGPGERYGRRCGAPRSP